MLRKLCALLVSILFSMAFLEAGLRLADGLAQRNEALGDLDLATQLARSAEARPEDARERFGLYGLVEASPHDDIVYRLKPNLRGTFRDQPVETNRYGHRQRTTPALPKPNDTFRIVGLGDSNMFGWGVPQGSSYMEQLEERLLERRGEGGKRAEVVNCAVPGYNTVMETATYEHVCRGFDPDLVVLHWVGNDFGFPHFLKPSQEGAATDGGDTEGAVPVWQRSFLVRRVAALLGKVEPGADASDELDPTALPELLPHRGGVPQEERRAARNEVRHMVGAEAALAALERLAQRTREDGVPVVFLILGQGSEDRILVSETAERLQFDVANAAPRFAAALEEAGVEGTPLDFKRRFTIPGDGHPSVEAHREYAEFLAEVIAPYLARSGL